MIMNKVKNSFFIVIWHTSLKMYYKNIINLNLNTLMMDYSLLIILLKLVPKNIFQIYNYNI